MINETHCLRLYGDTALPLQVHVVQHLVLHFTIGQKAGLLDDAVRQGGFTMIDMRDNAEISDMILWCHKRYVILLCQIRFIIAQTR